MLKRTILTAAMAVLAAGCGTDRGSTSSSGSTSSGSTGTHSTGSTGTHGASSTTSATTTATSSATNGSTTNGTTGSPSSTSGSGTNAGSTGGNTNGNSTNAGSTGGGSTTGSIQCELSGSIAQVRAAPTFTYACLSNVVVVASNQAGAALPDGGGTQFSGDYYVADSNGDAIKIHKYNFAAPTFDPNRGESVDVASELVYFPKDAGGAAQQLELSDPNDLYITDEGAAPLPTTKSASLAQLDHNQTTSALVGSWVTVNAGSYTQGSDPALDNSFNYPDGGVSVHRDGVTLTDGTNTVWVDTYDMMKSASAHDRSCIWADGGVPGLLNGNFKGIFDVGTAQDGTQQALLYLGDCADVPYVDAGAPTCTSVSTIAAARAAAANTYLCLSGMTVVYAQQAGAVDGGGTVFNGNYVVSDSTGNAAILFKSKTRPATGDPVRGDSIDLSAFATNFSAGDGGGPATFELSSVGATSVAITIDSSGNPMPTAKTPSFADLDHASPNSSVIGSYVTVPAGSWTQNSSDAALKHGTFQDGFSLSDGTHTIWVDTFDQGYKPGDKSCLPTDGGMPDFSAGGFKGFFDYGASPSGPRGAIVYFGDCGDAAP